jgi:NAD(P)-dependent dehydrogenase (short-subunit alcohol dehydrogenase family)
VLVHGRTRAKADRVEHELRQEAGSENTAAVVADLTSLAAVRRLAEEVRTRHPEIRVLVNNAGVYSPSLVTTEDGFEQTLQVQYLAPFLLTLDLLGSLQANAPARIVNVTSILHRGADIGLGFGAEGALVATRSPDVDLEAQGKARYDGRAAYATSKLLLTLFSLELADRLRGTGVTVNCVHPGGVDTKLLRAGFGPGGMPVEKGAQPIVHLVAAPGLASLSGRYFERLKEADPDPRAYDAAFRRRMWEQTERLLALDHIKVA